MIKIFYWIGLSILAPLGISSAFTVTDTGWTDLGATERGRQFLKREIGISSPLLGNTGVCYIHRKGEATRGADAPYLPFGLTTFNRNWERNGLLDLNLNGQTGFLYKNLSAVPSLDFLYRRPDAVGIRILFPCGAQGSVSLVVRAAANRPDLDFTLDLQDLNIPIREMELVLRALPGHDGNRLLEGKRISVPFRRVVHTAHRSIDLEEEGRVKSNPGESWLHLYDRDPAGGSCAILADPEVVNGWTLQGGRQNRQLTLTARVRPETRTLRFLLWEFQENTHTHDSAQAWLLEQAEALLQTVRTPPPEAADTRVAYRTVQTPEAPTLDGQADDPAWSLAEWSDSFLDLRSGRPVSPGTRFKSVYDLKHLYFLIRCEEPEPDQISASFREQDDAHLFRDDSIEIFLGPQNSALNYLHFAFNAAGSRWEAIQFPREARTRTDWNPEWDVAVSRDATGWTAEVRLPLLSLLLTADLDERWMLNLARNRAAGRGEPGHSAHQTWSRLTSGAFHEAESFNEMTGFDLEMAAYQQPEAFRSYGMRADKRGSPWGAGLELVRPGSDHLMLYYPNGTLFLPSDGTVLRSIFLFKETRPEVRETMEGRKGEAASRELLKNLSFHFRLPPGATLATNLITATSKVLVAESPEDGHWILRPQWPQDHGEYWAGTRLQQIPLFLRHTLPAGASAPIDAWVEYATSGESSPVIRSTLQIVDFPWVPRPLQRMVVNDMWMRLNDYRTWPNYVSALRKSGFTGISFFAGDLLDDGGQADRSYDREWVDARRAQIVELAREARETGLGVYLMDTTFNKVGFSRESQWGGLKGSGPLADPTYRGPIYWDDIADLTTAYEHLGGADWISIDTEVHKRVTERHFGYFDKAPDAAARILAQAKEKGTTVEDIFTDYGTEMIADVRAAIRKSNETLGIANVPPILIWNFSADEENPMEGLFEFRKLYPDLLPYLYPHVYFMSDSRKIGDRIKKHRRILGKSDIIACVTTSHFSQRDNLRYTELRDQLLECFFNGARGIEYWPALNDHNHLYGQLLALREIRPFEDLLLDGEYIVQTDDAAPTQIAGFIRDNEAVFLVSDYRLDFDGVIRVRNPFDQEQAVFHISESRSLGRVGPGESLDIRLEERRTAVLYFGDRYTGPEAP